MQLLLHIMPGYHSVPLNKQNLSTEMCFKSTPQHENTQHSSCFGKFGFDSLCASNSPFVKCIKCVHPLITSLMYRLVIKYRGRILGTRNYYYQNTISWLYKNGWTSHFTFELQCYNLAFILNNSVHLRLPEFPQTNYNNNYCRELPYC